MKKKILITTESLVMGGVETALLSLIKTLKKYDVDIDLFVLERGVLNDEFEKLTKVNIIDAGLPKNKLISRIMKTLLCKSIYKKYRKNNNKKYDIAIAFYGINNYCDLYAAAANAKQKFIWVHNNFETLYNISKIKFIMKLRNILMAKKFKYFDYIIPVSENTKKEFSHIFKNYDEKLFVINNIFDMDRLQMKNENLDLELKGKYKLMYVGRLAKVKNIETLIYEFEKVKREILDVKLYIIGDGNEREKLENIVKKKNLINDIIFLGNQNNPFKYMNQADILLSASKMEAYSINSLEALALKKYFISADNNGAEDIFYLTNKANLNNGIICKPKFIHKHIIYYLQNKDKFRPNFDMNNANKEIEDQLKRIFDL